MKYRKTLYTKTLILILKGNMLKYIFIHMQTTLCSQNYIYITYLIPVYCTTVQHTVALPLIYYILDPNSLNPQYHQMFAQVKTGNFCKFTLSSAQQPESLWSVLAESMDDTEPGSSPISPVVFPWLMTTEVRDMMGIHAFASLTCVFLYL